MAAESSLNDLTARGRSKRCPNDGWKMGGTISSEVTSVLRETNRRESSRAKFGRRTSDHVRLRQVMDGRSPFQFMRVHFVERQSIRWAARNGIGEPGLRKERVNTGPAKGR